MLKSKRWIKKTMIFLFWLLVWEILALAVANAIVLAGPVEVLHYLMEKGKEKELWLSLFFSLTRILTGFLSAFAAGSLLGMCSYRYSLIREFVAPFLTIIKAVPVAAVTVLLLLWFPSQYLSVVLCFIIVLPNVYEQMVMGLLQVDQEQLAMANCYGASFLEKAVVIYRCSAAPYLYSSMKICVGLSFKSAVAAEIIATPARTMGERLYFAKIHLDTPGIFAWTLLIVLLSALTEKILLWIFESLVMKPAYVPVVLSDRNRKKKERQPSKLVRIHLAEVCKSYGENHVIKNLNWLMEAGQCYVIMGESGRGKTTLLNLINGIVQPESGSIERIKGISKGKSKKQKVTYGVVFQNEVVLHSYDVIKNIEIFAGHKLSTEERSDLERLLPVKCLHEKCETLSGGMKRRVQIARAIFSDTSVLIMDEPFRGLDEANRKLCIELIKKYQKNRMLIIASHDGRDAKDLGGVNWKLELH